MASEKFEVVKEHNPIFFTKNQLRQHYHCDWPALVEVQKGGEDTQMGYR